MSKYRYRIARENGEDYLTIRKQRKGLPGLLLENWFWCFISTEKTIEDCRKCIERDKQSYEEPKIEILEIIE